MKLHLPLLLLSALLLLSGLASVPAHATGISSFTPSDNLGNVMYVGDSITHGVNAASYRWALHKILVDNGISQNEEGVKVGNTPGHLGGTALGAGGSSYGGIEFKNIHSAQSSARAYEIAGRTGGFNYGRFGKSNITNWLGLSNVKTDGSIYTGVDSGAGKIYNDAETLTFGEGEAAKTYTPDGPAPDTYFMMIGTNDLLSDVDSSNKYISQQTGSRAFNVIQKNLLGTCTNGVWDGTGDMDKIVDAMRTASGDDATIILTTVPTWSSNNGNNNKAEDYKLVVKDYNANLTSWAAQKGVIVVDVNKGMIDVANATHIAEGETQSYAGLAKGQMHSDGVHPTAQGDLLIAGNIARQLGYAGRTAGQERRETLSLQAAALLPADGSIALEGDGSFALAAGTSFSCNWDADADLSEGYTVTFSLENGLGNGATDGWNTTDALSLQVGNGSLSGTLSINEAYVKWGNSVLWSEDMSGIGEGVEYDVNDFRVAYVRGNPSEGLTSGFYVWMGDMLIGEALTAQSGSLNGFSMSNGTGDAITLSGLQADAGGAYAPKALGATYGNPLILPPNLGERVEHTTSVPGDGDVTGKLGLTEGYNVITVNNDRTLKGLTVNSGNYVGELVVIVTGNVQFGPDSYCSLHTGTGTTLEGNVTLTVDEHHNPSVARTWGNIFGVVNASSVTGNVNMNLMSDNLVVGAGGYSYQGVMVYTSVAGAYQGNVSGTVNINISGGTYESNIYGGAINGDGVTIGATALELHGGLVKGSVYAGGACGTVTGNTSLSISGGVTVQGNIVSAGGDFSQSAWSAGNLKNTIDGSSTLKLMQVKDGDAFAEYSGTISGGHRDGADGVQGTRSLIIEDVQLTDFKATLADFDSVAVNSGSRISLNSLGGATALALDATSQVELIAEKNAPVSYEMQEVSNAGRLVIGEGVSLSIDYTGDTQITAGGTYVLEGGSLDFGGNATASSVVLRSGTLLGASGVAGDISVDMLTATQVSFSGDISLAEACLALSADSMTAADAALLVAGDGKISITDSLTLNLDGELSQLVVEKLPGRTDAPMQLTMTGEEDPLAQSLLVANVRLDTGNAAITINLAEGYENYTVTATGIAYDEDGNSYVTYTVSSSQAVPEPATAALSLLALAGLAARRRRR